MLNRTVLVGRLTKDPELRYSPNGVAVCNFSIAVNRAFKSNDGQDADFINCVTFNKSAESLANYMSKGSLIGVDGRIQTRNYENKEGQRIFVTEIVADSVQFLESKKDSNKPQQNNQPPRKNNPAPADINSSDLPF